jgi:hypothetical protein
MKEEDLKFKKAIPEDLENINPDDFIQTCVPRNGPWIIKKGKEKEFLEICKRARVTPELRARWEKFAKELNLVKEK